MGDSLQRTVPLRAATMILYNKDNDAAKCPKMSQRSSKIKNACKCPFKQNRVLGAAAREVHIHRETRLNVRSRAALLFVSFLHFRSHAANPQCFTSAGLFLNSLFICPLARRRQTKALLLRLCLDVNRPP